MATEGSVPQNMSLAWAEQPLSRLYHNLYKRILARGGAGGAGGGAGGGGGDGDGDGGDRHLHYSCCCAPSPSHSLRQRPNKPSALHL